MVTGEWVGVGLAWAGWMGPHEAVYIWHPSSRLRTPHVQVYIGTVKGRRWNRSSRLLGADRKTIATGVERSLLCDDVDQRLFDLLLHATFGG